MESKTERRCFKLISVLIFCCVLLACGKGDPDLVTDQPKVTGTVQDQHHNSYPGVSIFISNPSEQVGVVTDDEGKFSANIQHTGNYEVLLRPPLSSTVHGNNPVVIDVEPSMSSNVNFTIEPQEVKAHPNIGMVDIFRQIRNKDGNAPVQDDEQLYAANTYEQPIGFLKEIKAPDGHTVTLAEFSSAKGTVQVRCNSKQSSVEFSLEGLLPNGTYTVWLAYLKSRKTVGQPIAGSDFVYEIKPPVGSSSGTENILHADDKGSIHVTKKHSSCILTNEPGLVIPIIYHINGKTFGGGEIPDSEQVVHMLAYFQ